MSSDPPLQLKPRLSISVDQAQSIVRRVASHALVDLSRELADGV
ncbi:hypothetical protein [Bradyrhizobium sp. CCBAU 53338]|nr:hypothetical protein [Bradyrhizobium sp. CCBAU 53338]